MEPGPLKDKRDLSNFGKYVYANRNNNLEEDALFSRDLIVEYMPNGIQMNLCHATARTTKAATEGMCQIHKADVIHCNPPSSKLPCLI